MAHRTAFIQSGNRDGVQIEGSRVRSPGSKDSTPVLNIGCCLYFEEWIASLAHYFSTFLPPGLLRTSSKAALCQTVSLSPWPHRTTSLRWLFMVNRVLLVNSYDNLLLLLPFTFKFMGLQLENFRDDGAPYAHSMGGETEAQSYLMTYLRWHN